LPENWTETFSEEELTREEPEAPQPQPDCQMLRAQELSARLEKISGAVEELKRLYAPKKETPPRREMIPYVPDSFWNLLQKKLRQLLHSLKEWL
jgi:hypothetical protein